MIALISKWLSAQPNGGVAFGDLNGVNPRLFITGGSYFGKNYGGRGVTIYWHRHSGSHQWMIVEGRPLKHSFAPRRFAPRRNAYLGEDASQ